jgi:hypothetical protein
MLEQQCATKLNQSRLSVGTLVVVSSQISLCESCFAHLIHRNLDLQPDLKLTSKEPEFMVTFVDG